eukprot:scaffold652_cov188-Chaetoceros_neogracile.AAC.8
MKLEGVKCEPLTIKVRCLFLQLAPLNLYNIISYRLQEARGLCDHLSASCPDVQKSEEYRVPATNDQADFGSLRILLTAALKSRQPH